MSAGYRDEAARVRFEKFNDNQPRDPAGGPTGGQWTSAGGGSADENAPMFAKRPPRDKFASGPHTPGAKWSSIPGKGGKLSPDQLANVNGILGRMQERQSHKAPPENEPPELPTVTQHVGPLSPGGHLMGWKSMSGPQRASAMREWHKNKAAVRRDVRRRLNTPMGGYD